MHQSLKYVTLGLCGFAWLFFLIGCVGYSNEISTVRNVAWIAYHGKSADAWYGLRKYSFRVGAATGSQTYQDCNEDFCNQCEKDGASAFGLLIVALLASTFSVVLSYDFIVNASPKKLMANAVFSFVAFLASIISIGVFMGECYSEIVDNVLDEDKLTWGPGSVLTTIGIFLIVIAFVMLVVDYYGSSSSSAS